MLNSHPFSAKMHMCISIIGPKFLLLVIGFRLSSYGKIFSLVNNTFLLIECRVPSVVDAWR